MAADASTTAAGFSRADRIGFALAAITSIAAVAIRAGGASGPVVFAAAGVAVMVLAYILGEATEQAGEAAGPRLAALLNASFGNLPELIIVVLTIREGLIDVARASIIGSVIGNVLLVLGASILLGGIRNGPMRFDSRTVGTNASMLALAVVALGVPTLFATLDGTTTHEQEIVSYGVALIGLGLYIAYLIHSFQSPESVQADHPGSARWTTRSAVTVLAVAAVATGVMSEVLVSAIEPTIEDLGIGATFIGLVVVPLLGNVPEHWAAVRLARSGDINFSMGIAFGSGLQVALLGTAIAVLAGGVFGSPVEIVFPPIELALLGAATLMTAILATHGRTNWLEGLQLLTIYAIAALAFWFL